MSSITPSPPAAPPTIYGQVPWLKLEINNQHLDMRGPWEVLEHSEARTDRAGRFAIPISLRWAPGTAPARPLIPTPLFPSTLTHSENDAL